MSDTTGTYETATHDGLTVSSNSETSEQMLSAFDPPAEPSTETGSDAPAEASVDAAVETTDEPKADTAQKVDKRTREGKKQSIQAEIDGLTRTRHHTQREVDTAQAELAKLRAELSQVQQPTPSTTPQKLTLQQVISQPDPRRQMANEDEFFIAYPDARMSDYIRYATNHGIAADRMAQQQVAQQRHSETEWTTRVKTFNERLAADHMDKAERDSLAAHVQGLTPASKRGKDEPLTGAHAIADSVLESDHPGPILRYLHSRPDEFQRLSTLHPVQAMREMGKLEARLEAAPSGPAPVPTSQAKPPIKPVGSSAPATDDEGSEGESVEAHIRRENAKERRLSRR